MRQKELQFPMYRRTLLKTLTGATVVGAAFTLPPDAVAGVAARGFLRAGHGSADATPMALLDAFNAQFDGYRYAARVGQWSVFFTGFKADQTGIRLCGQWLGWPGQWLPAEERSRIRQFFVAVVPGGTVGAYRKASTFTVDKWLSLEDFYTADGWEKCIAAVDAGETRLLSAMREAGVIA